MSSLRYSANCVELLGGIEKALVPARNVVIDLDTKDIALLCALHDVRGIGAIQTVGSNANVVGPVLLVLIGSL